MTVNERMFKIMKEKSIKSSLLANHLGINKTVVSNWKNRGNNPPVEYIVQICELLEIDIYELLGVSKEEKTKDEQELLNYYRKCSNNNKTILINAAKSLQELEQVEEEKSSTLKIG